MAGKSKKKSKVSAESYKNQIITHLQIAEKKFMLMGDLAKKCRTKKFGYDNFSEALNQLRTEGKIFVRKGQKISLTQRLNCFPGTVSRLSRSFGFAVTDGGTEYFVPGKFMLGAMPGDRVLINPIKSRTGEPEGEILDIIEEKGSSLTGRVEFVDGVPYLVPDTAAKSHLIISGGENVPFRDGDKVMAEIVYRGRRHSEHKVKITLVFGSAEYASSCAAAIIAEHGAPQEFPDAVLLEARKISEGGVQEYSFNNREDLRNMCIFTIDGAESKDLDDAVSVEKTDKGYLLGVHIADVSHYVKGNSALDKEALIRGTSIYYANRVIPMLPKELSNGICSLNPNENRLTLSAFIELDGSGEMLSYRFCKSVIRSAVKGVYSEVNAILSHSETPEIRDKYSAVRDKLTVMEELADILISKREKRHAPQLQTTESKLIIDENDVCIGVEPRVQGKSERIIEEFMLTANEAAAKLAREKEIPFVYRIHEAPPTEKTDALMELLPEFNITCPVFTDFKPAHAAEILEKARGTKYYEAVNLMVLRSMAKAKYSEEPLGHFGLALKDYAHFTSPIRRYPDLAIHRIITDILAGYSKEWLCKRYGGFAHNAAEKSSNAELRAVAIERECEDCYKAEFMKSHIGAAFEGRISGVTESGFFVELPDTVEGRVSIRSLPEGEYDFSYPISLTEKFSGVSYNLGDTVRVICAAVNVSEGKIDFVLDDDDE
jgi:ribonuclease R